MKVVKMVLGILNILVGFFLLCIDLISVSQLGLGGFAVLSPVFIAALFAFISGIITLKKKVLKLPIISLITAVLGCIYYFFAYMSIRWAMAMSW